jgi:hypothetical protein
VTCKRREGTSTSGVILVLMFILWTYAAVKFIWPDISVKTLQIYRAPLSFLSPCIILPGIKQHETKCSANTNTFPYNFKNVHVSEFLVWYDAPTLHRILLLSSVTLLFLSWFMFTSWMPYFVLVWFQSERKSTHVSQISWFLWQEIDFMNNFRVNRLH